ncbi:thiocillin family RiPP [Streptomyces sp. NBC_01278]|uniref:thiocillin family RiPP n=1 Tax=Streptomyces sp. NBC_01278 TaxID=2903809 RepID=UPI002E31EFE0|nr:thiocillin family RiPP [Streptomyces sp. NBC_01278]
MQHINENGLEVDLFAAVEASVEDLSESAAAGWSSAGTVSSAGSATGTFSSAATLSSYNS